MKLSFCLLSLCLLISVGLLESRKVHRRLAVRSGEYLVSDAENSLNLAMAAYCSGYLGFGVANWTCPTCLLTPGMKDIVVLSNFDADANGYVGYHSVQNRIVIGFSGTNPTSLRDWLDDLDFFLTDYPPCFKEETSTKKMQETNLTQWEIAELQEFKRKFNNNRHFNIAFKNRVSVGSDGKLKKTLHSNPSGCKVHGGFYRTYLSVSVALRAQVEFLLTKYPAVNEVLITGHSLGAAMAVHCAVDLLFSNFTRKFSILPLYTFGQPRVGDVPFELFLQRLITNFRIIHWEDPVPHLPPHAFGFSHNPEEIFYPASGDQYKRCNVTTGEDPTCSDSRFDWDVEDHLFYLGFDVLLNYMECRI